MMSHLINSFYSLSAGVSGCSVAACKQYFTVTNLERPSGFPNIFQGACCIQSVFLASTSLMMHAFPSSALWLLSSLERGFWNLNANRCGRVY